MKANDLEIKIGVEDKYHRYVATKIWESMLGQTNYGFLKYYILFQIGIKKS